MPPRKRKESNSLLDALQFISLAQSKRGTPGHQHCRFFGGWIVGTNGILSAGHHVPEEIQSCPQTFHLLDALKKCPDAISLTMLDSGILSVRSQDFQASIQCIQMNEIQTIAPDEPSIRIDNDPINMVRAAFANAGSIVSEKATTILASSVLLAGESILSSNGEVIVEAWHGCTLPNGLIAPKVFINALIKSKKEFSKIGFGADTMTIWFDDGSWLKTRLHSGEGFPNLRTFLDRPGRAEPSPAGFFQAVERLVPFSRDGRLYVTAEGIRTDSKQEAGASNYAQGLPVGYSYSIEALLSIRSYATRFAWSVDEKTTLFFGPSVRGAIGQRKYEIL